jgi:L-asparaginase
LATWGTISGAQANATDYGYESGDYGMNSLISAVPNLDKLPRFDIIHAHANVSTDLIEATIKNCAKGLVVACDGAGNMSTPALDALAAVAKQGVVVMRSARLPGGIALRNNEVNDYQKGFAACSELNPPKSRVLLRLALTTTNDVK